MSVPKYHIMYPEHRFTFVDSLKNLHFEEESSDLVFICARNIHVKAHKAVVAAVSEFLSEMFRTSTQDIVYISLPDVDSRYFKILTRFLYEGTCRVSLRELLTLKDLLSFLGIRVSNAEVHSIKPAPRTSVGIPNNSDSCVVKTSPLGIKRCQPLSQSPSEKQKFRAGKRKSAEPAHESRYAPGQYAAPTTSKANTCPSSSMSELPQYGESANVMKNISASSASVISDNSNSDITEKSLLETLLSMGDIAVQQYQTETYIPPIPLQHSMDCSVASTSGTTYSSQSTVIPMESNTMVNTLQTSTNNLESDASSQPLNQNPEDIKRSLLRRILEASSQSYELQQKPLPPPAFTCSSEQMFTQTLGMTSMTVNSSLPQQEANVDVVSNTIREDRNIPAAGLRGEEQNDSEALLQTADLLLGQNIDNIPSGPVAIAGTINITEQEQSSGNHFLCSSCGHTFPDFKSQSVHKCTGENRYECDFCDDSFMFWIDYQNHMMTHRNERPFMCNICKEKFYHRDGLAVHMRMHRESLVNFELLQRFKHERDIV